MTRPAFTLLTVVGCTLGTAGPLWRHRQTAHLQPVLTVAATLLHGLGMTTGFVLLARLR